MSDEQVEFTNEEDEVGQDLNLAAFSDAVLWGTDWTVETIVAQLRRGNIEINPRFQRRDAWNKLTKSRFIESVILGLPIPQVVLAERPDQRGKYIILDGKQRLLSLMQFSGFAEGENNAFSLRGLEVRTDLARKRFRNFERDPALQKDLNAFLTHTIRAVVIRNWPSLTFLHIVFQRLNTGSLKLSPQELRQALAPGEFINFVDDVSIVSPEIHNLLGRNSPDPRMRDVELLVRFLSFQLELPRYAGRMKEFLDDTCMRLNREWAARRQKIDEETNNFKEAIKALRDIFGEGRLARKQHSSLFNRSIFDALVYYAARPQVRTAMLNNQEATRSAYAQLISNNEFQEAVESDTAGIPHTATRLRLWGEILAASLDVEISIPQLQQNNNGELRFVIE